jgi:hypothetical protein
MMMKWNEVFLALVVCVKRERKYYLERRRFWNVRGKKR